MEETSNMRDVFSNSIIKYRNTSNSYFLTGDLGFMALENVQEQFGTRFINCGVAEQNMVGVAAGISSEGNLVIVYSIAPFCYARPFEQIRNNIAYNKLPVCLVGNGGGYGYGHMGPTHHALEDCSTMRSIGLKVIVPAFDEDLEYIIRDHINESCYLRLGYDCRPKGFSVPAYSSWRKLLSGECGVMIVLGPLAGEAIRALSDEDSSSRPSLWVVCDFTVENMPQEVFNSIRNNALYVYEEHVKSGGLGELISYYLVQNNCMPKQYLHRFALGYPSGRFGSQHFHRMECGLDSLSMKKNLFVEHYNEK